MIHYRGAPLIIPPSPIIRCSMFRKSWKKIAKSISSVVDNVRIAYKSTNNVGRLFSKPKDKQNIADSTNVAYRIDCKRCPKCYIGTTEQNLRKKSTPTRTWCKAESSKEKCASSSFHQYEPRFWFWKCESDRACEKLWEKNVVRRATD